MLKIAITGNIASGKSEVEKILSQEFKVFDTDKIAHELLDNLTEFEGLDVFTNGKIDRKKLGEIVFQNSDLRVKLERILHPQIKQRIIEIFEQNKSEKVVIVSVPLLFEVGWQKMFDKILFVAADEKIQLERLIKRNNLTKEQALLRINSQLNQNEKIKKSDFVIYNNSTKKELETEVSKLFEKI